MPEPIIFYEFHPNEDYSSLPNGVHPLNNNYSGRKLDYKTLTAIYKNYAQNPALENRKNFIYLDSEGYPTIGIGHLIAKANSCDTWKSYVQEYGNPFNKKKYLNFYDDNGQKVSHSQVEEELNNLFGVLEKDKRHYAASHYQKYTHFHMQEKDIDNLFDNDVHHILNTSHSNYGLIHFYKDFDCLPLLVKITLLDIAFNSGPYFNRLKKHGIHLWNSFNEALHRGDWGSAAKRLPHYNPNRQKMREKWLNTAAFLYRQKTKENLC